MTEDDKDRHFRFCSHMLQMMEDDESLTNFTVFIDEATSDLSGRVSRHHVRSEVPYACQVVRCSPKANFVLCRSKKCTAGLSLPDNDRNRLPGYAA